ncbi:MAG: DJ-1/PfpI family protein [Acidocella sp.]|nr:DJ-1/PfpI family protein [Acidocella sp.]
MLTLAMLVFDGAAAIDITGPLECFSLANHISGTECYRLLTVSTDGQPVSLAGGWGKFEPTHSFANAPENFDLLLVAGGPAAPAEANNAALINWLRAKGETAPRVGSICTGAFLLAASGLADGRRVTTHWFYAQQLAREFPMVTVVSDPIFIESDKIITAAGMTAGMDLALRIIELDFGRSLAHDIARFMVLHAKRAGGQSQFSMHLKAQEEEPLPIARVKTWISTHLQENIKIADLAKEARVSERTLLRLFKDQTNMTLGNYIADTKLRHACALLETTDKEVKAIAMMSGFATAETMRRVFVRQIGITPIQYRTKFTLNDA